MAAGTINFVSTKSGVSDSSRVRRIADSPEGSLALNWDQATDLDATLEDLDRKPVSDAVFAPVPPNMLKASSYRTWGGSFSDWAFRTQTLSVLRSQTYKLTSEPGESEEDFRDRLQELAEKKRADGIASLEQKYAAKKATYEARVLKAQQTKEKEAEQSRGRKIQTAISLGATVLRGIFGKATGAGTIGSATTAMRDVSRSIDEAGDVKRADKALQAAQAKLDELEEKLQDEIDELKEETDPDNQDLEEVLVRPRKSDIAVDALGLIWIPRWQAK